MKHAIYIVKIQGFLQDLYLSTGLQFEGDAKAFLAVLFLLFPSSYRNESQYVNRKKIEET